MLIFASIIFGVCFLATMVLLAILTYLVLMERVNEAALEMICYLFGLMAVSSGLLGYWVWQILSKVQ